MLKHRYSSAPFPFGSLCSPYDGSALNTSNLVSSLADLFEGTVQYNRDNREFEGAKDANITVSTLCHVSRVTVPRQCEVNGIT